jgi:uncharacterized protein
VGKQRAFFDNYLKGKKNTGVDQWPRVILEIRDGFYKGVLRNENEFPLSRAEFKRLYLDAGKGSLEWTAPSAERIVKCDSLGSGPGKHRAEFDLNFVQETEIAGYISAKVFMAGARRIDDMHVFVTLWKLDQRKGAGRYDVLCSSTPSLTVWLIPV